MTTFKEMSHQKFSITYTPTNPDQDRSSSEKLKFRGLDWYLLVTRKDKKYSVIIVGEGNKNICWSVTGKYGLRLFVNQEKVIEYMGFTYQFDQESTNIGRIFTTERDNKFLEDGCSIECEVEIISISGNREVKTHDFSQKDENMSDVIFQVQGKTLYANKAMLAKCSPVFYDLFYKNYEREVILSNTKYDNFETFLRFIYLYNPRITSSNVEALLLLACQYQVSMITDKCESFLMSAKKMDTVKKLNFAAVHQLKFLEHKCVESLNSLETLQEVCKDLRPFHQSTKDVLMAKMQELMKI